MIDDYLQLLQSPRYWLEAEDHAGNRSVVAADPPDQERIWVLGAEFKEQFGSPPGRLRVPHDDDAADQRGPSRARHGLRSAA